MVDRGFTNGLIFPTLQRHPWRNATFPKGVPILAQQRQSAVRPAYSRRCRRHVVKHASGHTYVVKIGYLILALQRPIFGRHRNGNAG